MGRNSDQRCTINYYALNKQSYNARTGLYLQEVYVSNASTFSIALLIFTFPVRGYDVLVSVTGI